MSGGILGCHNQWVLPAASDRGQRCCWNMTVRVQCRHPLPQQNSAEVEEPCFKLLLWASQQRTSSPLHTVPGGVNASLCPFQGSPCTTWPLLIHIHSQNKMRGGKPCRRRLVEFLGGRVPSFCGSRARNLADKPFPQGGLHELVLSQHVLGRDTALLI